MASPAVISVQQLARLVGTPDAPLLIDVRIDPDFDEDPRLIPTALRCHHLDLTPVVAKAQGRSVVVYCQKGLKLGQGAAALLRCQGVRAETLSGGHFAWRDAGLPLVSTEHLPALVQAKPTRWVTRQRPKIDRIACPWLIRRFVDPHAEFLFVAGAEVEAVADKYNAMAFDVEGGFWSHRGDQCSFDTFLSELNLHSEALQKLASLVRAADTDQLNAAPEAAGLLAVSLGLSRMYRDDLQQLEAGMLIYDAYYRWARDAMAERHDWPQESARKP